jgi:outer membrane receptor protein involved in Fe transport
MRVAPMLLVVSLVSASRASAGVGADGADPSALPVIVVYAPTPLHGLGIDPDKMPNTTRVMSGKDLSRSGEASLTGALDSQVGGVNLTNTFGNPNQPDLRYRGFTASPVEGTPQGLAVYQDGVRLNEAFGDTVNWDLVPDFAIQSLNLTSMNPVFGFNALGGAASIEMKDGFNFHGAQAQASAGSFRRVTGSAQYGASRGDWGGYLGVGGSNDSGWREGQPSRIQKLYADFGYDDRRGRSAHLSVTVGQDHLAGTGPSPVQLLALDRAAGATSPDYVENAAVMVSARGTTPVGDNDSLQGGVYFRHFQQTVENGNPTSATVCGAFYCSDSAQLLDPSGNPVPVAVGGQFPAELDLGRTNTNAVGGALQGAWRDDLNGRANQLTAGASLDYGFTGFESGTRFGSFDNDRVANAYLPVTSAGTIHDVSAVSQNSYGGAYFTDTFDLLPGLSLTASGRYNAAVLHLDDRLGGDLNGVHHYYRFNPAGGAAWKFAPWATAYADYAENNRVPTAAELSCADPKQSCSLASFFVADPDLHQVVARTYETGLRGTFDAGGAARGEWNADLFRTDDTNDILQVSAPALDRGYFVNAGKTRRQGVEASVSLEAPRWRVALDYGLIDATFQSPLTLSSPNNPAADGNGLISVGPGNRLPGVPRQRAKLSVDGALTSAWSAGVALDAQSGQYLQGDESNQTAPLAGFWTLSLHTEYAFTKSFSVFGRVDNLLDRRYDVYGTFTNQAGVPYPSIPGGISDPRSVTPAPPFAAFVGMRVKI